MVVSRHIAVVGRPVAAVARRQQQDHRDQFQSLLDRAGVDRAARSDPADAEGPELPRQRAHPHLRQAPQRARRPRRSTGIPTTRSTTGSSRTPAASIRSARCASSSPAPTASICTTRRRRTCSATTCASIPRAACACRTCGNWWTGCCATRRAGRSSRSTPTVKSGERIDAKLEEAGAGVLGLHHRLGDARRRGAVPRRHLQQGRPRPVRRRGEGLTFPPVIPEPRARTGAKRRSGWPRPGMTVTKTLDIAASMRRHCQYLAVGRRYAICRRQSRTLPLNGAAAAHPAPAGDP